MIILLVSAFVLPFGYAYAESAGWVPGLGDSGLDMSDPVVQKCVEVADAVETGSDVGKTGATCECVPPGEFDAERYSSNSEKVDEATTLFLISCTLPNDQQMVFPIRHVKPEFVDNVTNGTLAGTNVSVVQ